MTDGLTRLTSTGPALEEPGGRHPAALDFGDCFSYALAVARGEPLLLVGQDFTGLDGALAGAGRRSGRPHRSWWPSCGMRSISSSGKKA